MCDPNATPYDTKIDDVRQCNPAAIAVIGCDESKKTLTGRARSRSAPGKTLYGTDGNVGEILGQDLPPGMVNGKPR